ncbi:MAG: carboxypeptidase regulatory-like domain-containing protein [Bryobacteraceae bacterium]
MSKLLIVAAGLAAAACLNAQSERASLSGIITDATGAALPEARVAIENLATSIRTVTATNAAGAFYAGLLPGEYRVEVSRQGFATAVVPKLALSVAQAGTLNLVLELSAVQQQVTVEAQAPLLEQQEASLGATIQSEKILELPLLGRNPFSLVVLAPAVTPKGNAGTGPLINGGRSNANAVLLDGGQVLNSTTNDASYTPPLEAVQEFKVQTSSYSAEFGRSAGGTTNVTTKMGTNRVHGSLYEFFRNNALNANSYTNTLNGLGRDVLRRNEFGGALGGPVWLPRLYNGRNRSFFFANLEGIPQRVPNSTVATVPTAAERGGDFSQTVGANGRQILIYDPLTTAPDPARAGTYVRAAFPGNRVPQSRIDPVASKIAAYYPAPNAPGDPVTHARNYAAGGSDSNRIIRFLTRLDHVLSDRQRLFLRMGVESGNRDSNVRVNDAFPRQTSTSIEPIVSLTSSTIAGDTVTFRPNLIGEFRIGFTRNHKDSRPTSLGFDIAQLGFAAPVASVVRARLFPRVDVSDMTGIGPDTTALRLSVQENRQTQATITWVRGRHTMKVGADLEFFRNNTYSPSAPAGSYGFGRTYTQGPDPARSSANAGFGLATMLLGLATSGNLTLDPALATQQVYTAAFFQDNVRLSRVLTLDLGLRYEYTTPWKDRFNHLAYFDPRAPDPVLGLPGALLPVKPERRGQTDPDTNNFGPRIGIAWRFAPRTVYRAGYGLFYAQGNGGIGAVSNELGSGFQTSTAVYQGPPDPIQHRPPQGANLANPFVTGFNVPPSDLVGGSVSSALRDYLTPLQHQWTTSVQRQLTANLLVEAAYTGSRGEHLWQGLAFNTADPANLSLGSALLEQVPNPYYGRVSTGALSAPTVARRQLLLPFPQYSSITLFRRPAGDSVYHAFTLRADKRFSGGFSILLSYTASKLIDNTGEHFSSRTSVSNPRNLRADRSLADYDLPQRVVASFVWQLPRLRKSALGKVLGGWQVNGIASAQKGFPMVITTPNVTNLPGMNSRAIRVRSGVLAEGRTRDRWFDTGAFLPANPYTFGTDSRTQPDLRTPGIANLDFSLMRNQRIAERANLQFRAEVFNITNTPRLDEPGGNLNSRDFGRILGGEGNRVIQLGLRLSF